MLEEIKLQRAIHVKNKIKKKLAGLKLSETSPKTFDKAPIISLSDMRKDKKLPKKAKKLQKQLLIFESDNSSSSSTHRESK